MSVFLLDSELSFSVKNCQVSFQTALLAMPTLALLEILSPLRVSKINVQAKDIQD